MNCYRCGANVGQSIGLCKNCKGDRQNIRVNSANPHNPSKPAAVEKVTSLNPTVGFWMRFLANLNDGLIFGLFTSLVSVAIFLPLMKLSLTDVFTKTSAKLVKVIAPDLDLPPLAILLIGILVVLLIYFLLMLIIGAFYNTFFECSKLKATPGKFLLGIEVTGLKGEVISFSQSMSRNSTKSLCFLFPPLFFLISFRKENKALHDSSSNTRVRYADNYNSFRIIVSIIFALILTYGSAFISGLGEKKKSRGDKFEFNLDSEKDFQKLLEQVKGF